MGVSKIISPVRIEADNPLTTTIAWMQYLVGHGLSRWHLVEQDLTMAYLMLLCPADSPVDGALATFLNIQTVEAKIGTLRKVLEQVLYQDEMTSFRTAAKKSLNRIQTINETRNKIAHGIATTLIEEDGVETPYFLPYYNLPGHYRERTLTSKNLQTGIIKRQEKWDLRKLSETVEGLREGHDLSEALTDDLRALFGDQKAILLRAGRMTLDHGLPCVRIQTSSSQPAVSIAVRFDL